ARAALTQVQTALDGAGIPYVVYVLAGERVEPDERAVGSLCMAFAPDCDLVLAVGSGVINDCCKVLAQALRLPSAVVATAPSMDGYASNSSSMIRDQVKVTLYNACPAAIIADTMIMKDAPERMLQAGLGDMLAKYIALCEWRISHLVTGEYYCEEIAGLMRRSLDKIVTAAPRLLERDPEVIGAVTEGLILSGVAMAFAQVSRPASGLEHYFSHLWEMFALERGLPLELHGIQVGVGTLLCLRIYDRLRSMTPDREAAERAARAFDPVAWEQNVRRVFGGAAQTLIDSENNSWHKNDPQQRQQRMERIISHWNDITQIMAEELPDSQAILSLMQALRMPTTPAEIGEDEQDTRDAFLCSRDIRDKYLTSSLLWDLGLLEDFPLA
ncbi:MAG: sn-glycerol-1-phosphate dehydrogenase, partial [Eubacteriales bacterium]|nr:sn-glycerol-1-phosphate dehydrogenase [Eubacteriales bacterium]